uniref:caspase activity and apoptosis inhibitor 1 isoform X1 n=2 Tax=Myxine glutinosa TaxID=7769 RepID=UPI00358E0CCB
MPALEVRKPMKRRASSSASGPSSQSSPAEPSPGTARSGDAGESSDWEEGGMDLSVELRPIGGYICNRSEMLNHCMRAIGKQRLEHMLPDELKSCSTEEIRTLCLKQLEGMSPTQVRHILAGEAIPVSSDSDGSELGMQGRREQQSKSRQTMCIDAKTSIKQQVCAVDSTCSGAPSAPCDRTATKEVEQGYDSDVLSLVAKSDDNDQIELQEREDLEEPDDAHSACNDAEGKRESEGRNDLESDIDRCVKNILHLPQTSDALGLSGPTSQLEMLELELRARAIKALMKANERALESHDND